MTEAQAPASCVDTGSGPRLLCSVRYSAAHAAALQCWRAGNSVLALLMSMVSRAHQSRQAAYFMAWRSHWAKARNSAVSLQLASAPLMSVNFQYTLLPTS